MSEKIVVVTGASSGIGEALAQLAAERGPSDLPASSIGSDDFPQSDQIRSNPGAFRDSGTPFPLNLDIRQAGPWSRRLSLIW